MQINRNVQCISGIDIKFVEMAFSSKKVHKENTKVLIRTEHKISVTSIKQNKISSFTGVSDNKDGLPAINKPSHDVW